MAKPKFPTIEDLGQGVTIKDKTKSAYPLVLCDILFEPYILGASKFQCRNHTLGFDFEKFSTAANTDIMIEEAKHLYL